MFLIVTISALLLLLLKTENFKFCVGFELPLWLLCVIVILLSFFDNLLMSSVLLHSVLICLVQFLTYTCRARLIL